MTEPTSSAAPGRDVGAESALRQRLGRLSLVDDRLGTAIRLVTGLALFVVLVGACMMVALPNFLSFNCRAMQAEAKQELGRVRVAEETFRATNDRYSSSALELGLAPPSGSTRRYALFVRTDVQGSEPGFVAYAVGVGTLAGDVWTIDDQNHLANPANVCAF